ncbi:MAG TPA: penicillin-binding transpeptidase domain-containing protein [Pyrinomonadaceae bacterium]|nr:penicillin-binding transpeptidase domain-containing protein [Pyrinomonadaceae bacterium]
MTNRKTKSKRQNLKQTAFTRFMLIVAVFVLWIGAIGARLVHLQVQEHDWLRQRAMGQRQDVRKSKMLRGTIFDRDGRALAMSVNVKTLYADATEITDLKKSAKTIAKVLGVNENKLLNQLSAAKEDERRFVPLVKGLDEEAAQRVNKALDIVEIRKSDLPKYEALHWREDQKRSYPYQSLAAHVVGFSNNDGVGQAGIEQSQNDELYGAIIKKTEERDRLGRVYDETVSEKEPPKDVVLTLSTAIQYKAEEALAEAVKNADAKSGMAVVIDNRTGEILALANYPTFDPNKLNGITADNLSNGAIQKIYSPGSVFKLVTYGSALEKHLITPDGEIDAGNGTIEVANHKFRDSHAVGRVTYAKALAHSSNVCAIKTSLRVGKESFYDLVQKMGFGHQTGIELPAETGGIVRPLNRWNGDSLASMAIGYEIGVSALQMATAFATIANDGVRIQPHIIKEIRQSDETILSAAEPSSTRVVSPETARDLRTMLREVVLSGTGKRAQLDGYTSAGKTGTAWKFNETTKRIDPGKYISSFIGFAPAENPVVTIAVVMDEPKNGARDGGGVSAPVFRQIAEGILPELKVPRDSATVANAQPDEEVIPENGDAGDNTKGADSLGIVEPKAEIPKAEKFVAETPAVAKKALIPEKPAIKRTESPTAEKAKAAEPKKIEKPAAKPAETKPKGQLKNKSSTVQKT